MRVSNKLGCKGYNYIDRIQKFKRQMRGQRKKTTNPTTKESYEIKTLAGDNKGTKKKGYKLCH